MSANRDILEELKDPNFCSFKDIPALLDRAAAEIKCLRAAAVGANAGTEITPEMMAAGEHAWMHRNLNDPDSHPIRDCYLAMVAARPARAAVRAEPDAWLRLSPDGQRRVATVKPGLDRWQEHDGWRVVPLYAARANEPSDEKSADPSLCWWGG